MMRLVDFMAEAVDEHVTSFYLWHREEVASLMEPPSLGLETMLTWIKCDFPGEDTPALVCSSNPVLTEKVFDAQECLRSSMHSYFMLSRVDEDQERLELAAAKMKKSLSEYPSEDPVVVRKLQLTEQWLQESRKNSLLEKEKVRDMCTKDQCAASRAVSQLFLLGLFQVDKANMGPKLREFFTLCLEMDAAQTDALRIENTTALQIVATPQKTRRPPPVVEDVKALTPTEPCETQRTSVEDSQEVEGVEPTVPRAALPYLYFEMLLQLYTININCYIYI